MSTCGRVLAHAPAGTRKCAGPTTPAEVWWQLDCMLFCCVQLRVTAPSALPPHLPPAAATTMTARWAGCGRSCLASGGWFVRRAAGFGHAASRGHAANFGLVPFPGRSTA